MNIKFGPAGLGSVKDAEKTLKEYCELGLKACEIAFTYGVYIKRKENAKRIGRTAKKLGIQLSVHAPYWINLNSENIKKTKASQQRILKCAEIGHLLGAKRVVFHPGYYGKGFRTKSRTSSAENIERNKEHAFDNIKLRVREMLEEVKKNKWDIELCAETMGKVNVFGNIEEISLLVKETGCGFCLDFAHILAREKKVEWKKIKKLFPQKNWHCHFSGIEYGERGEKHHRKTGRKEWKHLFENLPKNKNITIINEAPDTVGDSFEGLKIWEKMKKSFS